MLNPRIGEDRPKVRRVVMEMHATVTVEWPEGVEFDSEQCKGIAANAIGQHWSIDVGRPGKIVWADCYGEASDNDVEIIENEEIGNESSR